MAKALYGFDRYPGLGVGQKPGPWSQVPQHVRASRRQLADFDRSSQARQETERQVAEDVVSHGLLAEDITLETLETLPLETLAAALGREAVNPQDDSEKVLELVGAEAP